MNVVVDASVAAKWFLKLEPADDDAEAALDLLAQAVHGSLTLCQPAHFTAEVAALLARLKPDDALLDLRDLLELDFRRFDDEEVYARGTDLAVKLRHHVFDTLYHALALSLPGATLVTADRRYYRKARALGQIQLLDAWAAP